MSIPPPPPGYPPQPGGYPPYGPYGAAGQIREHPDGTTVLVLGILGLVVCGLLAPFAWVKGNKAIREIDSQPQILWSNRGAVQAGRICGIIGSVLIILSIVFVVFFVLIAISSSS